MAKFITLVKFTAQGIGNGKDTVTRAEKVAQFAESLGGHMTNIMWTQGAYDMVVNTEFPDDETQAAFVLGVAMQGNVTTETMRAFTGDEVRQILAKLP